MTCQGKYVVVLERQGSSHDISHDLLMTLVMRTGSHHHFVLKENFTAVLQIKHVVEPPQDRVPSECKCWLVTGQVRSHLLKLQLIRTAFFLFCLRVLFKKSGCKIPRIELEDMGPSLDLVIRRTHLASDDLYKLSLKQPKALKVCRQIFLTCGRFSQETCRFFVFQICLLI